MAPIDVPDNIWVQFNSDCLHDYTSLKKCGRSEFIFRTTQVDCLFNYYTLLSRTILYCNESNESNDDE
jgi:hypothetical protein